MTTLQTAQRAYDNQAPDETPDPLEITEVVNWIDSMADQLMVGRSVKIGLRTLVYDAYFMARVANEAAARHNDGRAESNLGALILAALDYEPAMAAACARAIFGAERDWCKELAVELLEPFAADIWDHICKENADESDF